MKPSLKLQLLIDESIEHVLLAHRDARPYNKEMVRDALGLFKAELKRRMNGGERH